MLALGAGACTVSAPSRLGGPGCYAENGRSELHAGAAQLATATGGDSQLIDGGDCEEGDRAAVFVSYPGVSEAAIASRLDALSSCRSKPAGTPSHMPTGTTSHGWTCVSSGTTLEVLVTTNGAGDGFWLRTALPWS